MKLFQHLNNFIKDKEQFIGLFKANQLNYQGFVFLFENCSELLIDEKNCKIIMKNIRNYISNALTGYNSPENTTGLYLFLKYLYVNKFKFDTKQLNFDKITEIIRQQIRSKQKMSTSSFIAFKEVLKKNEHEYDLWNYLFPIESQIKVKDSYEYCINIDSLDMMNRQHRLNALPKDMSLKQFSYYLSKKFSSYNKALNKDPFQKYFQCDITLIKGELKFSWENIINDIEKEHLKKIIYFLADNTFPNEIGIKKLLLNIKLSDQAFNTFDNSNNSFNKI